MYEIFNKFKTIRCFDKNIFGGKNTLNNVNEDRSNLLIEIMNFKENTKPKDTNRYSLNLIFNF